MKEAFSKRKKGQPLYFSDKELVATVLKYKGIQKYAAVELGCSDSVVSTYLKRLYSQYPSLRAVIARTKFPRKKHKQESWQPLYLQENYSNKEIVATLLKHKGSIENTATELDIPKNLLYKKMHILYTEHPLLKEVVKKVRYYQKQQLSEIKKNISKYHLTDKQIVTALLSNKGSELLASIDLDLSKLGFHNRIERICKRVPNLRMVLINLELYKYFKGYDSLNSLEKDVMGAMLYYKGKMRRVAYNLGFGLSEFVVMRIVDNVYKREPSLEALVQKVMVDAGVDDIIEEERERMRDQKQAFRNMKIHYSGIIESRKPRKTDFSFKR